MFAMLANVTCAVSPVACRPFAPLISAKSAEGSIYFGIASALTGVVASCCQRIDVLDASSPESVNPEAPAYLTSIFVKFQ